jgi:Tfp pilus assembly protein PilV
MDKNNLQKGQSLFEVVLALGVIALILVAIISLTLVSVRNTNFTKNKSLATRYSEDTEEWLRIQKTSNWSQLTTYAAVSKRCMPDLDWTTARIGSCDPVSTTDNIAGTIFDREISLSVNNQKTEVTADVSVSWTDAQGFHKSSSSVVFQNWK